VDHQRLGTRRRVRSTPADTARYAQALLDGSAPGMDALTPRWEFGAQQIGYAWHMCLYKGHTMTFENGLTGGFTSKIALDRVNDRAAIVLSNTAAQVTVRLGESRGAPECSRPARFNLEAVLLVLGLVAHGQRRGTSRNGCCPVARCRRSAGASSPQAIEDVGAGRDCLRHATGYVPGVLSAPRARRAPGTT
jgi:CubicO group peptidase (beta-lactamase class C family)